MHTETTRINIEELSLLLAQQGVQFIDTNSSIDITLNRKKRAVYINLNKVLKCECATSLGLAIDLVKDGYFSRRCQLVVNKMRKRVQKTANDTQYAHSKNLMI